MSAPSQLLVGRDGLHDESYYQSLPREFYHSPEIFETEYLRVFSRQWILAGHMAQLPRVGSFFTVDLAGESIVVARSETGIHAFYNVCRHRGARVCTVAAGQTNNFACPYHAWTYALDGRLRNAPTIQDGEYIDYANYGLKPVTVESQRGIIFIYLGDTLPNSLTDAFAKMALVPAIDPATLKVVHETEQDVRANWKLVAENNLECYHCPVNHELLCNAMDLGTFKGDLATGDRYEIENDNVIAGSGPGLPLRPGASSLTITGELASQRRLEDESGRAVKNGSLHVAPIFGGTLFFPDYIVQHYNLPQSVDVTKVHTRFLVHAEAVEGRDYSLADVLGVLEPTAQEDGGIIENNARGVSSRTYTPGPLSKASEPLNHHMLTKYLEWMA